MQSWGPLLFGHADPQTVEAVREAAALGTSFGMTTGVVTEEIGITSRLVEQLTGYPVQPNKAIVGANAFAHESGIHQDGMLKDSETYQIMDPAKLGLVMTLPLGKHSGRHAFAHACAEAGIQIDGKALADAFTRFKALADSGKNVTLSDVFEGVVLA